MKFLAALLAHLLIGFFLCWGILEMMHGRYWLFVTTSLLYVIAFIIYGCLPARQSHQD